MFARNVCFSRSEWQDPRLMHPLSGAIGRFRIHGVRILPSRAPFRVERPEITHSAKNLPTLPGFSAEADRNLAERALRPAPMPGSIAVGADPRHLARAQRCRPRRHLRPPATCAPAPPTAPYARAAPIAAVTHAAAFIAVVAFRHPCSAPIAHVARTPLHPANERNCTRNSMRA